MKNDKELRNKLIRLAHSKPELREHLLPLVVKQASRMPDLNQAINWISDRAGHPVKEENPIPLLRIWRYEFETRDGRTGYGLLAGLNSKRKKKAIRYTWYTNESHRQREIDHLISFYTQRMEEAKKEKEERANFSHGLQEGDFLYASWGYNQTNVDYYQVIKVVTAKTVILRNVDNKIVRSSGSSDYVVPVPNSWARGSKPLKKRISPDGSTKIDSSRYATKWDGKPQYQTSAYYGH